MEKNDKLWIRGVNLGGLFLLERFITPYFFALTSCHLNGDFRFYPGQIDAPSTTSPLYNLLDPNNNITNECIPVTPYPVDEWTLAAAFKDKSVAKRYLEIHYENFVTQQDINFLKENGVTYVRVPLGHWIMGNIADDEPFVDGAWPYFKRLVEWCREAGIQVWPDIHTAPGSQNGFDNSGHLLDMPTCHGWDMDDATAKEYNATLLSMNMGLGMPNDEDVVLSKNVLRTLDIVNEITMAIAKDNMTDVVTGFGVLNEPFANCDINVVKKFDEMSLDIVKRNMGEKTSVYIGDIFNSTKWNDGWWTQPNYKGTYLDSHYYHVFDERPRHLSPRQHIALVCQKNRRDTVACCYQDEDKRTVPSKGISRIIGEWSVSLDTLVCDKLDNVMEGIRETGVAPEFHREIPVERQSFLRYFAEAQMVAYEAESYGVSSGWFYWTFKTEGGAFAEWDFMRGLKEGWMPKIPARDVASVDLYGSCYDILFKANDTESIIHEFPDPTSLDANNWQGYPIDDDVVVSHGQSLKKDAHGKWYDVKEGDLHDRLERPPSPHGLMRESYYWLIVIVGASLLYFMKKKQPKSEYIEITDAAGNGALELLS